MDWLKLFALLVAVTSIQVTADAPKKKIRIHLPQKVKHIHHHKKIYITNHPASSQYAPAFTPSAEGAVAVSSNVAMPAVTKVLHPFNSVEIYETSPTRLPAVTSAASKLLPLYRARGYYGPNPGNWDDQDDSSVESADGSYIPTAFSSPTAPAAAIPNHHPKRLKILKVEEPPKKKVPRKVKGKPRVVVRNKPQVEEEHPVSTFHEQFYADLDGTATIRKIKKPQRVEKIIDGDTEHIHTYSEEHIHKLVFEDGSRVPIGMGVDTIGSMSALTASHPIIPIKNTQSLLAVPPETLTGFAALGGSMGTPSHMEYAAYNPREVTHDHIFHDHGEVPADMDLTKEQLTYPPRFSYNGIGLRFKGHKNKHAQQYLKSTKAPQLSEIPYYESVYNSNPYNRYRNIAKPTISTPFDSTSSSGLDASPDDFRQLPSFKFKDKSHLKSRNVAPTLYFSTGKQQANVQAPYGVSSTVVHDYKPKIYSTHTTGSLLAGSGSATYNSYPGSDNYDFDSFSSPSNLYVSENPSIKYKVKNNKKKSISTQNISFGGLDHQTTVDHLEDSGISATSFNGISGPDNLGSASSTSYTIKESSPVHPYYSIMAVKALHTGGDQESIAASNDDYQYVEAPAPSPTTPPEATVSTHSPEFYNIQDHSAMTTESPSYDLQTILSSKDTHTETISTHKDPKHRYKVIALPSVPTETVVRHESAKHSSDTYSTGGKLKYGDKI